MANPIKPKRSYTANSVPLTTELEVNELAIRWTADAPAMFTKNSAGQIVTVALGGGGSSYTLPQASATVLGGVKVGTGLAISNGTLSVSDSRWDLFLPPAPTNVSGTAGNAQVSLTWTAPTVLSATPITDYIVQYSSNSGSTWTTFADGTSTTASATVTGLTNGTAYTFRVAGVNGVGTGSYSTATSSVTPGGDPNWSSVSLLLHGDGTGATITDSSANNFTVTANGGVTQSTTQSKFGGKSIYFDQGTNSYISISDANALDFGTGPFTIEMWYYPTAFTISGNDTSLMSKNGNDNWSSAWGFDMDATNLRFYVGPSPTDAGGAHGMSTGSWYHIAATRDSSNVCRLFVGGVQKGSGATVSTNLDNSNSLIIGSRQISGSYGYRLLGGYLDDIRITKGVCRYAANFTPATTAFPDS